MAITGYYDGNVIKTPYVFRQGQRVAIIPLPENTGHINQEKQDAINRLAGCIHSDLSLEEIREERLKKYDIGGRTEKNGTSSNAGSGDR